MNLDAARTRSSAGGSYEEYHPYGSTAWWAGSSATVSQKRYRFTGMERDDETGLQCHGVRYYAVWLGRWVSADPARVGVNFFAALAGNPVKHVDHTGLEPVAPPLLSEFLGGPILATSDLPKSLRVDSEIATGIAETLYSSQRIDRSESSGIVAAGAPSAPQYRHGPLGKPGETSDAFARAFQAILTGVRVLMHIHSHPRPTFPSGTDVMALAWPRAYQGMAEATYGEPDHGTGVGSRAGGRLSLFARTKEFEANRADTIRKFGYGRAREVLRVAEVQAESITHTLMELGAFAPGESPEEFRAAYFGRMTGLAAYSGDLDSIRLVEWDPKRLDTLAALAHANPEMYKKNLENNVRHYYQGDLKDGQNAFMDGRVPDFDSCGK